MTSTELRDYASVVAAAIALAVFVFNSYFALRNRRIENLSRFYDVHRRLFDKDGYVLTHLNELTKQVIQRPHEDEKEEASFHAMMLEVERLAILAKHKAIPEKTQVYMFGWYANRLLPAITPAERDNKFWELGLAYLNQLSDLAKKYESLPIHEREEVQA